MAAVRTDAEPSVKIERVSGNPIIHPALDPGIGNNINGPSLIETPDWIDNAPGRYLLYFAHHNGRYIRLAYSNDLEGPWHIYHDGVLPLADSHFKGHIASPDVHVDHNERRIRLYFHGSDEPTDADVPQYTRVALSNDGVNFTAQPELLGNSYLRSFNHNSHTYAIAMPGVIYRSRDGLTDFEQGPVLFDEHMRHCAVHKRNNTLSVFYTNAGDCPESILLSTIDISGDWMHWTHSEPIHIASPEESYEGSDLPLMPSVRGMAVEPVNELRDPAIFEHNGQLWLLYAVAGEQGIALARISE